MADSYDILAICGSLRAGSFNTHLLRAVASRAPDTLRLIFMVDLFLAHTAWLTISVRGE